MKTFQESERFTLFHNYLQIIRPKFDNRSIFCIDLSDITKTYGTHFEHMGEVFDGSTGNLNKPDDNRFFAGTDIFWPSEGILS